LTSTDLPTMTAACEVFGRHAGSGRGACAGTLLSLTEAHGSACRCQCHGSPVVRDLPATFAELVFTFPPCDSDVELEPVDLTDDDESALDAIAEMQLEDEYVGRVWGWE
jgi:hypothetical protein